MDRLPIEILEPILRSACTDDGSTGCALSGVSHHVRAMSAPIRYHSVALRGARQICAFLALLNSVNIGGPISKDQGNKRKDTVKATRKSRVGRIHQPLPITNVTVRHLFVADCKAEVGLWHVQSPAEWVVDADTHVGLFPRFVRKIKDANKYDRYANRLARSVKSRDAACFRADATIHDLLTRLALKLEHLCINQRLHSSFLCSPPVVSFPALVELVCRIKHPNLRDIYLRARFPVLERMHYVAEPTMSSFHVISNAQNLPTLLARVRFSDMDIRRDLELIFKHPKTSPWARQEALRIYVSRMPSRSRTRASIRSWSFHALSPQSQSPTSQSGPVALPDIDPVLDLDSTPQSDREHNYDQDHSLDHEGDDDDDGDVRSYHQNQDKNRDHDDGRIHDDSQDETRNNVSGPLQSCCPRSHQYDPSQVHDNLSLPSPSPSFSSRVSIHTSPRIALQHGWPSESSIDQYQSLLQDPAFRHAHNNVIDRIFVVDDNSDEDGAYDIGRLHREWLERVQGGVGCWKEGVPLQSKLY
jgi:hypothetical protein